MAKFNYCRDSIGILHRGVTMADREIEIAAVGDMLAEAWRDFTSLEALPERLYPRDLAEAAAMQVAMARAIGEPVVGWKVGGSPGPMVGRIFASHRYIGTAMLPAAQAAHQPAIECEVAFRLDKALPVRSAPHEREEVLAAATLVFAIEMVGTRFTDGKHIPDTEHERLAIVADNAAGAGLIVGPEVADWRDLSLLDIPVDLRIDGGAPMPPNPMEGRHDPAATLVWLANELSDRGIGLEAGQHVTTGSATLIQRLPAGSTAVARFADFGEITIGLEGAG